MSVYAPNKHEEDFLPSLTKLLLSFVDHWLVVGMDANAVVNPSIDRSLFTVHSDQESQALNDFIRDIDLCDIWRMKNENCRDYTFYSSRHKTFTRIDYILISRCLIQCVNSISILPMLISDHSAVACNLFPQVSFHRIKRWRFNTTLLSNEDFNKQLRASLITFLSENSSTAVNPQILWETVKCFLRGNCISYASYNNKSKKKELHFLENQIKIVENDLKETFSEEKSRLLGNLKSDCKAILLRRAEFLIHRTRQNYYFNGVTAKT